MNNSELIMRWNGYMCDQMSQDGRSCITPDGKVTECEKCRYFPLIKDEPMLMGYEACRYHPRILCLIMETSEKICEKGKKLGCYRHNWNNE